MRCHVGCGERFDLDQTATNAIYRVPFPANNSFAATPWRGVVGWGGVFQIQDFTMAVKSDHCSMRNARMSRTDWKPCVPRSDWMARNKFPMSSFSVT